MNLFEPKGDGKCEYDECLLVRLKAPPEQIFGDKPDTIDTRLAYIAGFDDGSKAQLAQDQQAHAEIVRQIFEEIESCLSLEDNDMGFVEISNHVPYSSYQSSKARYGVK